MTAHTIARRLSPAQRKALRAIIERGNSPYGWSANDLRVSGMALVALRRKGLLDGGNIYGSPVTSYRFNKKAIAVQAIIEEEGI